MSFLLQIKSRQELRQCLASTLPFKLYLEIAAVSSFVQDLIFFLLLFFSYFLLFICFQLRALAGAFTAGLDGIRDVKG